MFLSVARIWFQGRRKKQKNLCIIIEWVYLWELRRTLRFQVWCELVIHYSEIFETFIMNRFYFIVGRGVGVIWFELLHFICFIWFGFFLHLPPSPPPPFPSALSLSLSWASNDVTLVSVTCSSVQTVVQMEQWRQWHQSDSISGTDLQ